MSAETIHFNAAAVAPLAMFMASKHDIRFYLNGFCIMPTPNGEPGCIVAACDGHRLAVWHDAEGACSQQKIVRISPALVSACKRRTKLYIPKRVHYFDGRLVVMQGETELYVQAGKADVDGAYPDIFRVIPKAKNLTVGLHGVINTEFLKSIGEAGYLADMSSRLSGTGVYHLTTKIDKNGSGSIVSKFDGMPHFMVITMPMRGSVDWPPTPSIHRAFIAKETPETSKPATANFAFGSMGEEVSA